MRLTPEAVPQAGVASRARRIVMELAAKTASAAVSIVPGLSPHARFDEERLEEGLHLTVGVLFRLLVCPLVDTHFTTDCTFTISLQKRVLKSRSIQTRNIQCPRRNAVASLQQLNRLTLPRPPCHLTQFFITDFLV